MLTKGDRVMVFNNAHFAGGSLGRVRWLLDDEVGVWLDGYDNRAISFRRTALAHLPLPKEPCPMCGSGDEHHSTTTCEEDRHAE